MRSSTYAKPMLLSHQVASYIHPPTRACNFSKRILLVAQKYPAVSGCRVNWARLTTGRQGTAFVTYRGGKTNITQVYQKRHGFSFFYDNRVAGEKKNNLTVFLRNSLLSAGSMPADLGTAVGGDHIASTGNARSSHRKIKPHVVYTNVSLLDFRGGWGMGSWKYKRTNPGGGEGEEPWLRVTLTPKKGLQWRRKVWTQKIKMTNRVVLSTVVRAKVSQHQMENSRKARIRKKTHEILDFLCSFSFQKTATCLAVNTRVICSDSGSVDVQPLGTGVEKPQAHARTPDGRWAWVVCIACFLSNLIISGFTFSYGLLFPVLLGEFKQGKAKTGLKD